MSNVCEALVSISQKLISRKKISLTFSPFEPIPRHSANNRTKGSEKIKLPTTARPTTDFITTGSEKAS